MGTNWQMVLQLFVQCWFAPVGRPLQVSLSRFFSWNIRFAGWRRFWTFLRKLLDFRATVMGKVDIDQENAAACPHVESSFLFWWFRVDTKGIQF